MVGKEDGGCHHKTPGGPESKSAWDRRAEDNYPAIRMEPRPHSATGPCTVPIRAQCWTAPGAHCKPMELIVSKRFQPPVWETICTPCARARCPVSSSVTSSMCSCNLLVTKSLVIWSRGRTPWRASGSAREWCRHTSTAPWATLTRTLCSTTPSPCLPH